MSPFMTDIACVSTGFLATVAFSGMLATVLTLLDERVDDRAYFVVLSVRFSPVTCSTSAESGPLSRFIAVV